jgi:hypothetical protein
MGGDVELAEQMGMQTAAAEEIILGSIALWLSDQFASFGPLKEPVHMNHLQADILTKTMYDLCVEVWRNGGLTVACLRRFVKGMHCKYVGEEEEKHLPRPADSTQRSDPEWSTGPTGPPVLNVSEHVLGSGFVEWQSFYRWWVDERLFFRSSLHA